MYNNSYLSVSSSRNFSLREIYYITHSFRQITRKLKEKQVIDIKPFKTNQIFISENNSLQNLTHNIANSLWWR